MHNTVLVKETRVGTGTSRLGVVVVTTTATDSPLTLYPYRTIAASELIGDVEVIDNTCEASALLSHEHMCKRLLRG